MLRKERKSKHSRRTELDDLLATISELKAHGFSDEEAILRAGFIMGECREKTGYIERADPYVDDCEARATLAELGLDLNVFWIYLKLGAGEEVANQFASECECATYEQMKAWLGSHGLVLNLAYGKQLYDAQVEL